MSGRLYTHLLGTPDDHVISLNTIATREPMMMYVTDLINNLCLKNGVRISIGFTKPEKSFNDFFEQYFVSILPNVLRYKMYCGFIPWVVTKHPVSGDRIPILLPIGSFSWHIKTKKMFIDPGRSKGRRRNDTQSSRNMKDNSNFSSGIHHGESQDGLNQNLEHNCASEFIVESVGDLGISSEDIYVINLLDPMLLNSSLTIPGSHAGSGQAQFSPLYVPLQRYLALDVAQQRRLYADDWNTTARLFTTKNPPNPQNERAGRDEVPYGTTRFQQVSIINPKP